MGSTFNVLAQTWEGSWTMTFEADGKSTAMDVFLGLLDAGFCVFEPTWARLVHGGKDLLAVGNAQKTLQEHGLGPNSVILVVYDRTDRDRLPGGAGKAGDKFPRTQAAMPEELIKELDRLRPMYRSAYTFAVDARNNKNPLQQTRAVEARQLMKEATEKVEQWRRDGTFTLLQSTMGGLASDAQHLQGIRSHVDGLQQSLEERQATALSIASILDLDADELKEQLEKAAADDDDAAAGTPQEAAPQELEGSKLSAEERDAEATRLLGCLRSGALSEPEAVGVWEFLKLLSDDAQEHTRRLPVNSRPKWVFGIKNDAGEYPLYLWGQSRPNYGLIGDIPAPLMPLLDRACAEVPEACFNHMMVTIMRTGRRNYIPPHRDAAFSKGSHSDYESATPIVLYSFGCARDFHICELDVPDTVRPQEVEPFTVLRFPFQHNSMFTLDGSDNVKYKHTVPQDLGPDAQQLRVSVVLRCVDKAFVSVQGGYWTINGDRRMIENCKNRDGSSMTFMKQADPMKLVNLTERPVLDEHDLRELRSIIGTLGDRSWEWGNSSFQNKSWLFVASDAEYNQWINAAANTRPLGWGEFSGMRDSVLGSGAFSKLKLRMSDADCWGYIRASLMAPSSVPARHVISIEGLGGGALQLIDLEFEAMEEMGLQKTLIGKSWDEIARQPEALTFAAWLLRKNELGHSRSASRSSTVGSLPPVDREADGDEEPAPKAKAKAKAKSNVNPAKRQRMA